LGGYIWRVHQRQDTRTIIFLIVGKLDLRRLGTHAA
jgi:hypothetical protein